MGGSKTLGDGDGDGGGEGGVVLPSSHQVAVHGNTAALMLMAFLILNPN